MGSTAEKIVFHGHDFAPSPAFQTKAGYKLLLVCKTKLDINVTAKIMTGLHNDNNNAGELSANENVGNTFFNTKISCIRVARHLKSIVSFLEER